MSRSPRRSRTEQRATRSVDAPPGADTPAHDTEAPDPSGRVDQASSVAPSSVAPSSVAPPEPPEPRRLVAPGDLDALVFDPDWYRANYADVAEAGVDPVRHYLERGWAEGRWPNPHFDTRFYVSSYPDVLAAGLNPFLHFLLYGAREGRAPRPSPRAEAAG